LQHKEKNILPQRTPPPSILDVERSISKYGIYAKIKAERYANGEGTVKALNVEREKYTGYHRKGYRIEIVKDKATGKPIFDRTEKKILVKWYQRGETLQELERQNDLLDLGSADLKNFVTPSFVNKDGKLISNVKEIFRFVPRNEIKGGAFLGLRHEWKKGQEIEQTNLTDYAKKTLKRSARLMKWKSGYTRFLTLTYGKDAPDCKEAKKHLKQFIQRLTRKLGKEINYLWVAEMQKGKILENGKKSFRLINGSAIHFHLLIGSEILPEQITKRDVKQYSDAKSKASILKALGEKIDKRTKSIIQKFTAKEKNILKEKIHFDKCINIPEDILKRIPKGINYDAEIYGRKWVQNAWGKIVNDWQKENGFEHQVIDRIDNEKVQNAGKYISKYMSKDGESILGRMWGMSDTTRELIKPIEKREIILQHKYCEKILQQANALFIDEQMMVTNKRYYFDEVRKKERFKTERIELKDAENYLLITDKNSKFFNQIKDPGGKILTSKENGFIQVGSKFLTGVGEKKDYTYKPEYPIVWSNNIALYLQYVLYIIQYYDKNPKQRSKIVSLNNVFDEKKTPLQLVECDYF
jgi:hypothetical protein